MSVSIDDFKRDAECVYKDERYSVRDNGAVMRYPREGKRLRKDDNQWTFGKPNDKGYMNIGSERINRIVATAFHGEPPTEQHIADHIDTNRSNNRPENLRWFTKLENALNNPITRKKIEFICGCSVEEFLANPEKYRDKFMPNTSFAWMRTVTAEEGTQCLKNLLAWAVSDKKPSGGALGEWIYQPKFTQNRNVEDVSGKPDYVMSLTPGAAQRNWKTPTEFPNIPQETGSNPLAAYANNLKSGTVLSQNQYGTSLVVNSGFSEDHQTLYVMTESSEGDGAVKHYALAQITYEDRLLIHAGRTFFSKEGAEKQFTLAQGLEWTGGDSIDDYC